jgi:hypothetical protein
MKRRLLWGGLGPTCCTWANTLGVGEVNRLLPRITFVGALLLSGSTDNHAVGGIARTSNGKPLRISLQFALLRRSRT